MSSRRIKRTLIRAHNVHFYIYKKKSLGSWFLCTANANIDLDLLNWADLNYQQHSKNSSVSVLPCGKQLYLIKQKKPIDVYHVKFRFLSLFGVLINHDDRHTTVTEFHKVWFFLETTQVLPASQQNSVKWPLMFSSRLARYHPIRLGFIHLAKFGYKSCQNHNVPPNTF